MLAWRIGNESNIVLLCAPSNWSQFDILSCTDLGQTSPGVRQCFSYDTIVFVGIDVIWLKTDICETVKSFEQKQGDWVQLWLTSCLFLLQTTSTTMNDVTRAVPISRWAKEGCGEDYGNKLLGVQRLSIEHWALSSWSSCSSGRAVGQAVGQAVRSRSSSQGERCDCIVGALVVHLIEQSSWSFSFWWKYWVLDGRYVRRCSICSLGSICSICSLGSCCSIRSLGLCFGTRLLARGE